MDEDDDDIGDIGRVLPADVTDDEAFVAEEAVDDSDNSEE